MPSGRTAWRFTPAMIEKMSALLSAGHSLISVSRHLTGMLPPGSPPTTPGACRSKACALGLRTRPRKMHDVHEVRIGGDVMALLKDAADLRGISVQRLASLILSATALDKLCDAIIDDQAKRHLRLQKSALRSAQWRRDKAKRASLPAPLPDWIAAVEMPAPMRIQFESMPRFAAQMAVHELSGEIVLPTVTTAQPEMVGRV